MIGVLVEPYSYEDYSVKMFMSLPIMWFPSDPGAKEKGIATCKKSNYIDAVKNSIRINLLASAQQSLLQGDILLPMLKSVLDDNGSVTITNKDNFIKSAAKIVAENPTLRKNLLLYMLYKAYEKRPIIFFDMDYSMSLTEGSFKEAFGEKWTFEFGQDKQGARLVSIKMPCPTSTSWGTCSYPLPTPTEFHSGKFVHSVPTILLASARAKGNRLLCGILFHQKLGPNGAGSLFQYEMSLKGGRDSNMK